MAAVPKELLTTWIKYASGALKDDAAGFNTRTSVHSDYHHFYAQHSVDKLTELSLSCLLPEIVDTLAKNKTYTLDMLADIISTKLPAGTGNYMAVFGKGITIGATVDFQHRVIAYNTSLRK